MTGFHLLVSLVQPLLLTTHLCPLPHAASARYLWIFLSTMVLAQEHKSTRHEGQSKREMIKCPQGQRQPNRKSRGVGGEVHRRQWKINIHNVMVKTSIMKSNKLGIHGFSFTAWTTPQSHWDLKSYHLSGPWQLVNHNKVHVWITLIMRKFFLMPPLFKYIMWHRFLVLHLI